MDDDDVDDDDDGGKFDTRGGGDCLVVVAAAAAAVVVVVVVVVVVEAMEKNLWEGEGGEGIGLITWTPEGSVLTTRHLRRRGSVRSWSTV